MTHHLVSQYLSKLGIFPGDVLLIHASFKSMRSFEHSPEIFIEHILKYITVDGTLCMPALSYDFVNKDNPCFHETKTQSCVGILPETFRQMQGVVRSMHPTHSVCAYGKYAHDITGNHWQDSTPCGPNSPFNLIQDLGAKTLMIGCGLKPNTSMHAIEELSRPEYLFGKPLTYVLIDKNNQVATKTYQPHNFKGWIQRYDRILNLDSEEWITKGKIFEAESFSFESQKLWKYAQNKMKVDPLYFVEQAQKTLT